jgi:hypothetical protein
MLWDRMSHDGRSLWGYRVAVLSVTFLVGLIAAYMLATRVNALEERGVGAPAKAHRKLLFSPVYPVSPFFLPWRPRRFESWQSWQPRALEFDVNGGEIVGEMTAQRSGYTGLALSTSATLDVADKIRDERFGGDYSYEYYDDTTGEWIPADDEDIETRQVNLDPEGFLADGTRELPDGARFGEAGAGFGGGGVIGRAAGLENLGAGLGAVGGALG